MRGGPCSIAGCDQPSLNRGWCSRHYQRWYKHGDPLGGNASPTPVVEQENFLRDLVGGEWPAECVKWPYSRTNKGYGVTTLDGVRIAAHRACCKIAHGQPPTPEHQAAHSCGKGHEGCINPRHLRWATPAENAADMKLHGTAPVGAANPAATLSDALVLEIYALKDIVPQPEIARRYGIPQPTISDILRGTAWASVTGAVYVPGRRRGASHHASKFQPDQIHAIRAAGDGGEPCVSIARRYGVAPFAIQQIVKRKSWKWLEEKRVAA